MTTPVIEAGDISTSVDDGVDTDPATVQLPSYSSGDLVIVGFATDTGSITHTLPTAGPNSETINTIVANNDQGGGGGPDSSAFWYVATANETTPTIDVTISSNARWYAVIIVVPAGEFDSTTPIQTNDGNTGSSSTTTTASTPTWTADGTANGRVVGMLWADTQSMSGTATGWTVRENTDHGRVSQMVTTRDAANTASESIAAADYTIDSADTYTSIGFIVNEPAGAGGRIMGGLAGLGGLAGPGGLAGQGGGLAG